MTGFLPRARLDALEQLREKGLTDQRDACARGSAHVRGGRLHVFVKARAALWVQRACVRAIAVGQMQESHGDRGDWE